MNPEEFQNQKPMDDSFLTQSDKPTPAGESLNNLSAESGLEKADQNPSVEAENYRSDALNTELQNSTVISTDETTAEVTMQIENEIVTLESETINLNTEAASQIAELQRQEQALKAEIASLQTTKKTLQEQVNTTQITLTRLVQESLSQLEQRKQALQIAVEQLERRQDRIRNEMRTTFAGASQELAIRVQGFKDYLTGSLQDLATAAEQLQLVPTPQEVEQPVVREVKSVEPETTTPQFVQQQFQDTTKQIRRLIDQYRTKPDYYGPAWQLRRTFEPVHAERVSNWFFGQGGRGALRTMGSRLQNILVASAVISILHRLYGDRVRTLVLANSPERLGEWRRGLQDCLGIGRPDFGPDRGVALFETPEALAQKADRLTKANQLPLIVIDDSEEQISLAILQFPLWLAFAPDPRMMRSYDDDF